MDPEAHPSGLYEVIWMDGEGVPRRHRFYSDSDLEKGVYEAAQRMADNSRHGYDYIVAVRQSTPDW